MSVTAGDSKALVDFGLKTHLADELEGDLGKGILWPSQEPVDSGVVDQSRVHSAVVPKGLTNWTHADTQVHVVFDLVVEELQKGLRGFHHALLSCGPLFEESLDPLSDDVELVIGVDIWDNTTVEHVLDILEE